MRRRALLLLSVLAATLFALPAVADETFPASVRVIADDEYVQEVDVGGNASFSWTLVNLGNETANVTVTHSIEPPAYGLVVTPERATLPAGGVLRIYANVTVPDSPPSPSAQVSLDLRLEDGSHTHRQATVIAGDDARLPDLVTAFIGVGAIIFIGFFASLVFERSKIPDMIFLIFLGLALGPVLVTVSGISLIPDALVGLATPYFAAVALMIILFDGGLNLNVKQVVQQAGISVFVTLVGWVGSVFVISLVAMAFLGYPFWVGVLLGAILGGTSGAVVISLVRGMRISEDTRTILVLESTITDVLCILGALTVIGILRGGGTLQESIGDLLAAFSVALFLGFVVGLFWLRVLSGMQGKPFGFMLTIAALFILYAGTEALGASGGMAALIFGLMLGNHREVGRALRIKEAFHVDDHFKQFDSEISFVVRTFFFVFLGFTFTFEFAGRWEVETPLPLVSLLNNTFPLILLAIALMFLGIYVVRAGVAGLTTRLKPQIREDRGAIGAVIGRGLAAAVLASLPFAIPPFTDPAHPEFPAYNPVMAPFQAQFITIALFIILLTVVATSVGVIAVERRRRPADFAQAATESLGRVMREESRQTRKAMERKVERDRRRRQQELRRIEKALRAKRKR